MKRIKKLNGNRADRYLNFISDAYSDYIAARVLLCNELLSQGSVLASSAVEKYIKALLTVQGADIDGHLKKAHLNSFKNQYLSLHQKVDPEFLELCCKCYKLRYSESLRDGFTLSINQWGFLAELDSFVHDLERSISASNENEGSISKYDSDKSEKDKRLWQYNHRLLESSFLEIHADGIENVYGILKLPSPQGIMEVSYKTKSEEYDKNFLKPGLILTSKN